MKLKKSLIQIFGHSEFRDPQYKVVKYAIRGFDELVVLPTGSGKSICYQLPALLQEGVTIIISPLKSLIKDQITNLASRDIKAVGFYGEIGIKERRNILRDLLLSERNFKILYTTPETITRNLDFIDVMNTIYGQNKIERIVIDEAHCISMWGNDFRPAYRDLKNIRLHFPKIPIMALTATATPTVQNDIVKLLKFRGYKKFMKSYFRSNLYIKINKLPDFKNTKQAKYSEIKNTIFLSNLQEESGIIYCNKQKTCEEFSSYLNSFGISTVAYHAGMKKKIKDEAEEKWKSEEVKIIVATIAFGMGIDKPNVRFVIHHNLPTNIESYYQEIGRAGRDGVKSFCILYYSKKDIWEVKRLLNWSTKKNIGNKMEFQKMKKYRKHLFYKLNKIIEFCDNTYSCRHYQISNYLGEEAKFTCDISCDNCIKRV